MRRLNREEVIDILKGCTVLGTGGGGNLSRGIEMIDRDFEAGRYVELMSLSELPDDALVGTPYGCGAPKRDDEVEDEKFRNLPHLEESPAVNAFRRLEKYLGKKFTAVSSTELGGENTAEALHTASLLGIPVIDADPAGRSVPELQHSTYYIKNIPICPAAVATHFGETMILESACNDFRAEDMIRAIAVVSDNDVGVVDHPMNGGDYKNSIIPDAISMAESIGKIIRERGNDGGRMVAEIIARANGGRFLFRGVLTKTEWEQRDGFNIGYMILEGIDDHTGSTYRIDFKNENMVAYRNEIAEVMIPDLICMIGADGEPFTIPNFTDNMEINVFALPAHEYWRTEKGLSIFGPAAMGYELDYKPLEIE